MDNGAPNNTITYLPTTFCLIERTMRYSQRVIPIAGLILYMFFWGSSFIAMKIAFRDFAPLHVIFWRLAIASCCFLLILPRLRRQRVRPGDWRYLGLMALFEPLPLLHLRSPLRWSTPALPKQAW